MAFGKIDGEKSNEGKDLGASRYLFEISKSGNFSLFQSGRGICDKEVNAPIKSEDIFNYTNDDIDSHYLDSYTNAEPTRNYNIESVEHSSSCLSRDDIIDKTYSNLSTNKDMLESLDESGKKYFACLQNDLIVKDVCHLETAKTSTIFWGLHTNCEDEIFKYIFDNNQNMTWEEVKFYGIGFWLKSTTILKSICEKLAKNQFQAKHNPLDAALYYLILGKKNMLVYLFRTVKDKKLMDFFNQDFSADRFRVSALKNAYALLGMQRFEHAAAFFLLSGDVQGCIQTIITKAKDLQLAFLIVKMINAFSCMEPVNMENFVCRYVVEIPLTLLEEWKSSNKRYGCFNNVSILSKHCRDPFINSIAFWHIQEYFLAGHSLLIRYENIKVDEYTAICQAYTFLRKQKHFIRQLITYADIPIQSHQDYILLSTVLGSNITTNERKLMFKAIYELQKDGCTKEETVTVLKIGNLIDATVLASWESMFKRMSKITLD